MKVWLQNYTPKQTTTESNNVEVDEILEKGFKRMINKIKEYMNKL
jgi:hypothetical protein